MGDLYEELNPGAEVGPLLKPFVDELAAALAGVLQTLTGEGYTPPSVEVLAEEIGQNLREALIECGEGA